MARVRKRIVSWWGLNLILANAGLFLLFGAVYLRFGSISRALGYARGERLLPDQTSKFFGTVKRGTDPSVSFMLKNESNLPVKVLGAKASCTCLVLRSTPHTIPAGDEGTVQVQVMTNKQIGEVSATLVLYTDVPGHGAIRLSVNGFIDGA